MISFSFVEDTRKYASFDLNSTFNLNDPRFGGTSSCVVCDRKECSGHFASLSLGSAIYHPTFMKEVQEAFNPICKKCCADNFPLRKNAVCVYCGSAIDADCSLKKENSPYEPRDVKRMLEAAGKDESKYIIDSVLVPPKGIRSSNISEWPTELNRAYETIVSQVKNDKDTSKTYEKIVDTINKSLSGKEGVFRSSMIGKRVDQSMRTVITGDPNIEIDEILIPRVAALKIRTHEAAHAHNIVLLKEEAAEGKVFWRGRDTKMRPEDLVQGESYDRCVRDGDLVYFNRQPSLSKDSFLSFRVSVRKDDANVISMNEMTATPFNGDFDGDEMNVLFGFDFLSRAEMLCLANVKDSPFVGPIQDTITGAYMMTKDHVSVSRNTFMDCCSLVGKPFVPRAAYTGRMLHELCSHERVDAPVTKDEIFATKDIRYYRDLQKVVGRWMQDVGFSISISSYVLSREDLCEKSKILDESNKYHAQDKLYENLKSRYRDTSLMRMIESKGKGTLINASQITMSVGKQDSRSLKGGSRFVRSSYIEGLTPDEYFVHSIAARDGVVDTGLMTSSTGYENRRSGFHMGSIVSDYLGGSQEGDCVITFPLEF